ncbi:MAG: glycosyltransferase [Burkholderiales bacterium]|nr:MAG: glycosyltransferase [Burkholderiales bacterium]
MSVVIASYQHAAYVGEAIDSVLAQRWQDFEIVITDDGSTDGTPDVIRGFRDPRIALEVLPANRGACIALNRGVRRARGELIAILNSDDAFEADKLAVQVRFLEANPSIGAVFTRPQFVDEHGAPFTDATHKDYSVFDVENRDRFAWLRQFFDAGNCLCHPTLMIRRSCYDAVGLYDARLAQVPDLDMWIRLVSRFEIHVLAERLTRFRIRAAAMNASGGRPQVIRRDAWERQRVLEHYLKLDADTLARAFPEDAREPRPPAHWLAERALARGTPFHFAFGLETLFRALAPDFDDEAYSRFIELTGRHDPFGIHRPRSASGEEQARAQGEAGRGSSTLGQLARRLGLRRGAA